MNAHKQRTNMVCLVDVCLFCFVFSLFYIYPGASNFNGRASLNGALTQHKHKDIKTLKLDN